MREPSEPEAGLLRDKRPMCQDLQAGVSPAEGQVGQRLGESPGQVSFARQEGVKLGGPQQRRAKGA